MIEHSASPRLRLAFLLLSSALFFSPPLLTRAETIKVKSPEGTLHGYLTLHDQTGKNLATGELIQTVSRGNRVHARLVYRFRDGSIDDERSVFTQNGTFRLVSDHHIQKGPSFPHPIDLTIDLAKKQVTVLSDRNANPEVTHLDLPDDLANGSILTLLKNIDPATPQIKLSYLAATPKPRLIKLAVSPSDDDAFRVGNLHHKAKCMLIHIDLGGITGAIAPLIGKQPGDVRVWVEEGEAPAFIREEGAFYVGGPTWTVQLTSPVWNK